MLVAVFTISAEFVLAEIVSDPRPVLQMHLTMSDLTR